MKTRSVGELIQIARRRAADFQNQADSFGLHQKANLHSSAARELQTTFEAFPRNKEIYTDTQIFELVVDAVAARRTASECFIKVQDIKDAAYELRYGAYCLELFAKHLVVQEVERIESPLIEEATPLGLLREALELHDGAIELFRFGPHWQMQLAFELSYTSKTLTFLRERFNEYKGPEIRDRIISFRTEAAPLFNLNEAYKDANFEYLYLMTLYQEMAKEDHSYHEQLAEASLGSAEACSNGRLNLNWQERSLWTAVNAYHELTGSCSGAQKEYYLEAAKKIAKRAEGLGRQINKRRK